MIKLYKWQNIIILIIGIATLIGITIQDFSKIDELSSSFFVGYLLDLITGVGINIIILWLIFQVGNLIYRKVKQVKQEYERTN